MEAAESPLEVLSRAAVMLQRNVLPPPSYDEARSLSQHQQQQRQKQRKPKTLVVNSSNGSELSSLATTTTTSTVHDNGNSSGKWKREKKFQHKTTMSICDSTSSDAKSNSRFTSILNNKCTLENEAEPLDMSKRTTTSSKERGEPPSYFQSILCSNYARRQAGVPAVIFPSTDKTPNSTSSSVPSSDDKEAMCDQVINEHFRRSLGRDYLNVFSTNSNVTNNKNQKNGRPSSSSSSSSSSTSLGNQSLLKKAENDEIRGGRENGARSVSPSPLSVDDHFAKALGDTWIKLQQQQQQKQIENQNKNSVRSIQIKHDPDES